MIGLHVNFARQDGWSLRRHDCPTCKKRTRFFGWFQEWYGWELTCLSCGEVFHGEEGRAERPFMRGWRKLSIQRAWKLARKCKANGVPFIGAPS